jgi:hypothetical protein
MHQVLFGSALLIPFLGGAAMLAGGVAVLAGWKPVLPMPALRSPSGHGYGAAYGLGLFSGIASACCAPVLAGVVVLTGSTASFGAALAVSVNYVAGMVAPLAVLALVWERRDWGSSRLLHGRRVRLGAGRLARQACWWTAGRSATGGCPSASCAAHSGECPLNRTEPEVTTWRSCSTCCRRSAARSEWAYACG